MTEGVRSVIDVLTSPNRTETASPARDEADLVTRAKAMDERAWEELLHEYYPRLQTYLWNRIGDRTIAEDLASEVFEEAVARIKDYEWRGLPFSAWLFRIARNRSADHLRKRARRTGATIGILMTEPAAPGEALEREMEAKQLRGALVRLTDEQRQVVVLRFMSDRSTAETATILNKSEGAIKAIQHRALRSMRRVLGEVDPLSWGVPDAKQ